MLKFGLAVRRSYPSREKSARFLTADVEQLIHESTAEKEHLSAAQRDKLKQISAADANIRKSSQVSLSFIPATHMVPVVPEWPLNLIHFPFSLYFTVPEIVFWFWKVLYIGGWDRRKSLNFSCLKDQSWHLLPPVEFFIWPLTSGKLFLKLEEEELTFAEVSTLWVFFESSLLCVWLSTCSCKCAVAVTFLLHWVGLGHVHDLLYC